MTGTPGTGQMSPFKPVPSTVTVQTAGPGSVREQKPAYSQKPSQSSLTSQMQPRTPVPGPVTVQPWGWAFCLQVCRSYARSRVLARSDAWSEVPAWSRPTTMPIPGQLAVQNQRPVTVPGTVTGQTSVPGPEPDQASRSGHTTGIKC